MSPRGRIFKPQEIVRTLERNGFVRVSQKGSHVKLRKQDKTIIVPDHKGKDISFGLGCAILKRAGINPDSV